MATASVYPLPTAMRRPFRLNRRRVLSVGLMLSALIGGLAYVNGVGQQPTYPVLIAAHDLPRGSVIAGGDFLPERVALPESMAPLVAPAMGMPASIPDGSVPCAPVRFASAPVHRPAPAI